MASLPTIHESDISFSLEDPYSSSPVEFYNSTSNYITIVNEQSPIVAYSHKGRYNKL